MSTENREIDAPPAPPSRIAAAPVAPAERIAAIDVLRGFAILGILIMNVQSFSMPGAAYMNPTAYGDLSGLNRWVWIISHLAASAKFMTIFSMLFGAGIALMTSRIEARGISPRGPHYRRTMWLIAIGLVHAYVLWYGDILVTYGLCGLVVYLFRRLPARRLLAAGLAAFAVASLLYLFFGWSMRFWPPEAIEGILEGWKPGLEAIERDLAAYRGGWLSQMPQRAAMSAMMETFYFVIFTGWRSGGLMLIGMALYKWDVLTGRRSNRFYAWMAAAGFAAGLPLVSWGIARNFAAGWDVRYSMFTGSQFNYWGSLFVSSGYIGAVMLFFRSGALPRLSGALAATGRMALTNYLAQTLICVFIFYGYGFGLYGSVERIWHPPIILAVWIAELLWSPWWLRRFRFGPAEWLWRSLTYRKAQPMRRGAA